MKIAESIHPVTIRGLSPSGTFREVCAASAAKLIGLDAKATEHCSDAASLCAGIRVNFAQTKPLHVGRAAQNASSPPSWPRPVHRRQRPPRRPWGLFQVFSFGDGMDEDRSSEVGGQLTQSSHRSLIKAYPEGGSGSDDGADARAG